MLSKTAHVVYISVIVVLLAVLLSQRGGSSGNARLTSQLSQANQRDELDSAANDAAGLDEFRKETSLLEIDDSIDVSRPSPDDRSRLHSAPGEPPWDRSPGPDGASRGLPGELVTRSIQVASDIDSDMGARLAKLRDKNSADFERQLRRSQAGRRLLALAQLKDREPELYRSKLSELTQAVQINRVAADLRDAMRTNTDPGRIEALKANLRALLQVQFVMSIKSRGEYLCRIEEQVTRVREDIDREVRHFQSTIEVRLKHLTASDQPIAEQSTAPQAPVAVPASSKIVQPQ